MGTGHIISDIDSARRYLTDELTRVDPDSSVLLIENLAEDFSALRINLAPFKSGNFNPSQLLDAFLASAESRPDAFESFLAEWESLIEMVEKGLINLDREDVLTLNKSAIEMHYPAMHHSEEYARLNNPAYRLVRYEPLIRIMPEMQDAITKLKTEWRDLPE